MEDARDRSRTPPPTRWEDFDEDAKWDKKIDSLKDFKSSLLQAEVKKASTKLEPYDHVIALYSALKKMKPGEPLSKEAFDDLHATAIRLDYDIRLWTEFS